MAGPIFRLKDLMVHTGLSRSAIYDRMDKKSPRYAEDFPRSFSLSGGAIGWFKSEVDAWLESCAANAKSGTRSKKVKPSLTANNLVPQTLSPRKLPESSKPGQKASQHPVSAPMLPTSQSQTKRITRPGNLGEAIVEGGKINGRLLHYLQMNTWTPAMGALLISGIEPPLNCNAIPDGGIGLDNKPLSASNARFHEARRVLSNWHDWNNDVGTKSDVVKPHPFLDWCISEGISTEWLRLLLELSGYTDENSVDLTSSRFALLTNK